MRDRILLCKPKMCGRELDYIKPALAEDWTLPMEPRMLRSLIWVLTTMSATS